VQVAAAHCPNERTLDPADCSYNRPTYAPASSTMAFTPVILAMIMFHYSVKKLDSLTHRPNRLHQICGLHLIMHQTIGLKCYIRPPNPRVLARCVSIAMCFRAVIAIFTCFLFFCVRLRCFHDKIKLSCRTTSKYTLHKDTIK